MSWQPGGLCVELPLRDSGLCRLCGQLWQKVLMADVTAKMDDFFIYFYALAFCKYIWVHLCLLNTHINGNRRERRYKPLTTITC